MKIAVKRKEEVFEPFELTLLFETKDDVYLVEEIFRAPAQSGLCDSETEQIAQQILDNIKLKA